MNPTEQWLVGGPYFAHRGYCVFELDYGQYDGIPLVHGIAPIEQSGRQLAAYVDRVLAATGASQVDIVGHSQGGGALPRYYLKFLGGAPKVHTLVGIAPTNHGGTASGMFTLAQQIPGATQVSGRRARRVWSSSWARRSTSGSTPAGTPCRGSGTRRSCRGTTKW